MLGTTHATNAVLERRRLQRVAVLRIGAPATRSMPPLLTWPDDLRGAVSAGEAIVGGGIEFDGRELAPFDADAAARFLERVRDSVEAVAVAGVFSPVSPTHELAARELAREVLGDDIAVSLSHEIGSIGLIERENATVLNAALAASRRRSAAALEQALADHGIAPTVYFTQNDGTLMALDYAIALPGADDRRRARPTRCAAAAFLTGCTDALVVDVGGTSTDVGVLVGGFPRESAARGRDRRHPHELPHAGHASSIALGGGTIVRERRRRRRRSGRDSVGYRLADEALVFGGDTPTLTDAAVAAGRARRSARDARPTG